MSRCELTVKDDFRLTEKTMRTSHFKANAIMKAAVLAASILLFGVSASFGQQTVNLTAAPTTTTLPDGTTVPMWGYFCGTAVATDPAPAATCGALNPSSVSTVATVPSTWSPVMITVPYVPGATSLTISLTNNLSFTPTGATTANAIPTSIIIVGQLRGADMARAQAGLLPARVGHASLDSGPHGADRHAGGHDCAVRQHTGHSVSRRRNGSCGALQCRASTGV